MATLPQTTMPVAAAGSAGAEGKAVEQEKMHRIGISSNNPQFIAREFKHLVHLCGITHILTGPFYSQSTGKLERRHGRLKHGCIRPTRRRNIDEVRRRHDRRDT